ncbi:glycosyltransferase family 4 protein [Cryomorpha ignava]|uniref:Glycosyltransferase family 4 protein n=1 Tax=Cryomorpha ignava TaxID=101383 RepID=A0A7K3WP25_9FLAO|nr:glycosyltransferase [Cryomorpha ignava]NEN23413.1 glycosyltransferase family 4 protein [Cryomorpha ignava]
MKRVLIVCPYPEGKAPSQRFRFEQYLPYLRANGLEVSVASFWTNEQWPAIYGGMSVVYRVLSTVMAFVKRFFLLFSLHKYQTVFIHREAAPLGPPWWEWCAAKIFRKRLIYDFDDAVWLPNSSQANAKLVGNLKNHGKTGKIISWSETVFAGNSFLASYAKQFCDNVKIVPTTIDCNLHDPNLLAKPKPNNKTESNSILNTQDSLPTIGWTGTHSTLKQLTPLFPLLEKVYAQLPFRFLLIADIAPEIMPEFVEFRKWNKQTEITDLLEIDIGIMPLYNTDWERGKCGFKALQYMALEIPAVVSGVGVNSEIVIEMETGLIAEPVTSRGGEDYLIWESSLLELLKNEELRLRLGKKGRKRVKDYYSVEAFKQVYLETLATKS